MGPGTGTLWITDKFLALAEDRTRAVQPVARRYTDTCPGSPCSVVQ
jgi:hypothetical protein